MTVYEEIKRMNKQILAKWIIKLIHEGPDYLTEVHCRLLCDHRENPYSECDLPAGEDCTVTRGDTTDFEIVIALLN